MGLREAVSDVADQMEQDAKQMEGHFRRNMMAFVRQLRTAIKASEGEAQPQTNRILIPEMQHEAAIAAEREKLRLAKQRANTEETANTGYVACVGGDSDGDTAPIDPNMPQGAKTMIGACVYVLRGNQLHYDVAETEKISAK